MSVGKAMENLMAAGIVLGPKGGNTQDPRINPIRREAPLNAKLNADGFPSLHRGPDPHIPTTHHGRLNEDAWHRLVAFMVLNRRTNSEIAAVADCSVTTIAALKAQRWFCDLLATLANKEGEDITALIKSETAASIAKLVELRDHAENEKTSFAAARELLIHGAGMPTQRVLSISAHTTFSNEKEELKALNEEINTLMQNQNQPT